MCLAHLSRNKPHINLRFDIALFLEVCSPAESRDFYLDLISALYVVLAHLSYCQHDNVLTKRSRRKEKVARKRRIANVC